MAAIELIGRPVKILRNDHEIRSGIVQSFNLETPGKAYICIQKATGEVRRYNFGNKPTNILTYEIEA